MSRVASTPLAQWRERRRLTQEELAALCGIKRSTLSSVENGHVRAWPKLRRRSAEVLGVPELELFPEAAE